MVPKTLLNKKNRSRGARLQVWVYNCKWKPFSHPLWKYEEDPKTSDKNTKKKKDIECCIFQTKKTESKHFSSRLLCLVIDNGLHLALKAIWSRCTSADHPYLLPIWSWRRWLFVSSLDCRRWLLSVVVSVTSLLREFDNRLPQPRLRQTMLSSEALVMAHSQNNV